MTDGQAKPDPTQNAGGSFTQEDVNRIVEERLARERGKYADYETLKTRARELEEREQTRLEAEKTEHQKAIDAARKEERKKADAEWQERLKKTELSSAIATEFVARGLDKDLGNLLVGEFAVADAAEVPAKIDALLAAKPYLKGQQQKALGVGGTPSAQRYMGGKIPESRVDELRRRKQWLGSEEEKLLSQGLAEIERGV